MDGTFGAGGHSRVLLRAAKCKVYAIDKDPSAENFFIDMQKEFGEWTDFLHGNFSLMQPMLAEKGINSVNGIILDLGVSSMQLDQAERGFSFMHTGKLDMRMSQEGLDAKKFINQVNEKKLADIIYQYGDEPRSRRIAKSIVESRSKKKIETTTELAEIIRMAIPRNKNKIDAATKTFQAIRIWLNDELTELQAGLDAAANLLAPEGRMVVIAFHSLEDKIVKDFFRLLCKKEPKEFIALNKKIIRPGMAEIKSNPRARSARMRGIQKLGNFVS